MPKAKCPLCHYETDDLDPALSAAQLNLHALFHTQQNVPQPKLDRPRIDVGVEEEVWNSFIRKFNAFKVGSGINATNEPTQILSCCTDELTRFKIIVIIHCIIDTSFLSLKICKDCIKTLVVSVTG